MKSSFSMRAMSAAVAALMAESQEAWAKAKSPTRGKFLSTNTRRPHQSAREKMRRVRQGHAGTQYSHGAQYSGNERKYMRLEFHSFTTNDYM